MHLPSDIHQLLVVFPHPDDEVFGTGGLFQQCAKKNISTTLAIFTKGERGTPDGHTMTGLKKIRSRELLHSSRLLRIKKLIHYDMGDGQLEYKKQAVEKKVTELIATIAPDLVITYDLSGLYGHPDHMTLSEITTAVMQKHHPKRRLWYTTLHPLMFHLLKLPVHMARDPSFITRRTIPNRTIPIGSEIRQKLQAARVHKSQKLPYHMTLLPWEFFYEVQ